MKVWREYFITLLEGVKGRVIRGGGKRVGEDGELEISREEIRETVCGLKDRKAAGMDEVPRYGNMKERRWKGGYGYTVIRYGGGKNGRIVLKKE